MIRQSFNHEDIVNSVGRLDIGHRGVYTIEILETPRGSAAKVSTGFGNFLVKHANLENTATEQGINPPRSVGLRNEAGFLSRLRGNVPRLHYFGSDEHGVSLITEYVNGLSLRSAVKNGAHEPTQVTRALLSSAKEMHDEGVLHGDIHPANTLINNSGDLFTIDFELAHEIDHPGIARGNARYLSPEEASRALLGKEPQLDQAEETFSLTVTCLEILTGKYPTSVEQSRLASRRDYLELISNGAFYSNQGCHEGQYESTALMVRILHDDPVNRPQTPHELDDLVGPLL